MFNQINHPEMFTDGVRVLMLINRAIGNTNKGSYRWVNKLVSTCTEEFRENLERLAIQQDKLNNSDLRIYGAINARKTDAAVREFQIRQLKIQTDEERRFFYKDLNNQYVSCLMKPENRATRYYLVDIDKSDADAMQLADMAPNRLHHYKTPKGWHVICKPFDVRIYAGIPHVEVKKDGLMIWRA